MKIGGFQKTSFIDCPGKITSIIFTQGCSFRCPYCHNPELVKPELFTKSIDENEILEYLYERRGKIDAVTITGGEPTLQPDLKNFILKIKAMKFFIKLDSNGTSPQVIKNLLDENLIDYVAMDIKAPINYYKKITQTDVNIENITASVNIIMKSGIDYEFRTTVVNNLLSCEDIIQIGKEIKGAKKYFLQNFRFSKVLDEKYGNSKSLEENEMEYLRNELMKYVDECDIR